jgi:hypothetical protein
MDRESALRHWRLGVERASYAASLAERRYRAVDPDNRLVARGLERAWEESLTSLEAAKVELAHREEERPRMLSIEERDRFGTLGPDLATVWTAATTTPRDRKELLGTLIEEVIVKVERDKSAAHLTLGSPLPRHCDRRHPQSAGPQDGARSSLRGQSCLQPADALEDSVLRPEH